MVDLGIGGLANVREIGRGERATVYRAAQPAFDREVAVKVLHEPLSGEDRRERFAADCRAIGLLGDHPHVVALHDAGFLADGRPYQVLQHVTGDSLRQRIEQQDRQQPADVLEWGVKLADALQTAHALGILHLGVNPKNVLFDPAGEPYLSDFGLAETAPTAIDDGWSAGFVAPEVAAGGEPDPSADVFGLAATLFAALSGVAPSGSFGDDAAADLRADGCPASVADTVAAGMAPADRRIGDAQSFGARLVEAQDGLGLPVTEVAVDEGLHPGRLVGLPDTDEDTAVVEEQPPEVVAEAPTGRPRWHVPAAIAAALAILVLLIVVLWPDGGDDDDTPVATTTTTTTTPPITEPEVLVLQPVEATATATADPSQDAAGNPVDYAASNTLDGDPTTTWRAPGDGTGLALTIRLAEPSVVRTVGAIPGYAKTDPIDGSDRFTENRRVQRATWTFDDGSSVTQEFADVRDLQSIDVDVETTTIVFTIDATTAPGARDFVAVSEFLVEGFVP